MANSLIPQYLELDFDTMKARLKDLLSNNTTFKDYDLEGANITILMELMCYMSALTTYYINRVAKNCYIDTSDTFETTHMLSSLRGYNPQGYRSSSTDLSVTVTSAGASIGDQIKVPAWKSLTSTELDGDGDAVSFVVTSDYTETIPTTASFPYTFTVPVRQGVLKEYEYAGADIIDNKISLPSLKFDYDDDLDDSYPSMQLSVGSTESMSEIWTRVFDFYDELSGLSDIQEVYMLKFNKYKKYIIEFSTSRKVPTSTQNVYLKMLETLGEDGNVTAATITSPETEFLYNVTNGAYVSNSYVTVTNNYAATGGSIPDTIQEIKDASTGTMHSQFRNVTKYDYVTHLESRSDIVAANVWGEQEVAPSGSMLLYNKVYLSLIPSEWGTATIDTSAASAGIDFATAYSNTWKTEISTYLEPRKMLCAYEEYSLPDLVYFTFDIGIKVKRTYDFDNVYTDVRNKLIYYFNSANRSFNETISMTEISEYLLDPTNVSTTDNFDQVRGIQTLVMRDVNILTHSIYEPNTDGNYPQYTVASSIYAGDNRIRNIVLDNDQFPMLSIANSTITEEE